MRTDFYDVIIVGAGFAGLVAARELGQSGKSVLVLEGADRVGGRAYSTEFNGVPIELGGGYVHWVQPHVWTEITRYDLTLVERPYYSSTNAMNKSRFLIDGELQNEFSAEETASIKTAFAQFMAPASEVFPQPHAPLLSSNVQDFDRFSSADRIKQLDLSPLQRASLLRTLGMQCNNSASVGGCIEAFRWYALANCHDETYAASVSRFTLAEGTGHLLNCIADDAGATIILNQSVSEVIQSSDQIDVVTDGATYHGTHCIVATGVNVWKSINFQPAISGEKTSLSAEELSGKGAKIMVEIKGRFRDSRWSAVGSPTFSVLPHYVSDEKSVVVLFTNPEFPLAEVTKETLQNELNRFDDQYEVTDYIFHDWVQDEFSLGTWGNFRLNQFSKYFEDAQTPEGRIHFATGDIAHGWRGFFDGAIESGLRAARKVLDTA